jgi:uncharacterized membrane protein YfcA
MDTIIIVIVAMFASFMTFFSGFGLGTLLLPAFALVFPIHIAIAMTAIVHLLNNIFKSTLMKSHIYWKTAIAFGIPALIAAVIGANILNYLVEFNSSISYDLFSFEFETTVIKLVIATLIFVFALFDLVPRLKELEFSDKMLPFGGFLSGFFGGLSGHQGALRSTFLIKANLKKEVYIATGIIISLVVDISRLVVYGFGEMMNDIMDNYKLLVLAVLSAFIGAILGKKYLTKVTIKFIRLLIGLLLILISFALALGIM